MNVAPFDDAIVFACVHDAHKPAFRSRTRLHPPDDADEAWTVFREEAVHFPPCAIDDRRHLLAGDTSR